MSEPTLSAAEARIDELRSHLAAGKAEAAQAAAQLRELEAAKAAAEARADAAGRALEEERRELEEASKALKDSFRALAAEALRESREDFLTLAEQRLKTAAQAATSDFDERHTAIESLIKPLQDAIDQYRREAAALEERRSRAVGQVEQQYREVATAAADLQRETAKLVNALRSPHVRGRWGQITLRRIAELSGMVSRCDFYEQETVEGERRLRPDVIVRLPNSRVLVVDSKVPLDAFLDAVAATTEPEREGALQRYARQTREHVNQLASKEYQGQLGETPEFTVLFIPNDSFLAAAADKDPDLLEDAFSRNVVIATPATLIALLKVVAHGWREVELARNAEIISRLAQQLGERLAALTSHVEDVGAALARAVEAHNRVVGSLESRVLPAARRFRALGANVRKDIPELAPIELRPRPTAMTVVPEGAQPIFPEEAEVFVLEPPTRAAELSLEGEAEGAEQDLEHAETEARTSSPLARPDEPVEEES